MTTILTIYTGDIIMAGIFSLVLALCVVDSERMEGELQCEIAGCSRTAEEHIRGKGFRCKRHRNR